MLASFPRGAGHLGRVRMLQPAFGLLLLFITDLLNTKHIISDQHPQTARLSANRFNSQIPYESIPLINHLERFAGI